MYSRNKKNRFGIIVLAAGRSSRLGTPKQLLLYNGRTLLQHIVDSALNVANCDVLVVTGAYREKIEQELVHKEIYLAYNANWEQGMGSSIICGVNFFSRLNPRIEGVIICVCDQPFVTSGHLLSLIEKAEITRHGIIASGYSSSVGPPIFFSKIYFSQLKKLLPDEGARNVILSSVDDLAILSFEGGAIDIDTPQDYDNLLKSSK